MVVRAEPLVAAGSFRSHRASPLVMMLQSDRLSRSSLPSQFPIAVHVASDWEHVVGSFNDQQHGCVLVDFDTDRNTMLSRLRQMRQRWHFLTVVACSEHVDAETAFLAGGSGCVAITRVSFQYDDLLRTIQRACQADLAGVNSRYKLRSSLATLTTREAEVLQLFVVGMNTKTIAKRLDVSYQTIDKHRNRALKKMNCGSLVELAITLFDNQR